MAAGMADAKIFRGQILWMRLEVSVLVMAERVSGIGLRRADCVTITPFTGNFGRPVHWLAPVSTTRKP